MAVQGYPIVERPVWLEHPGYYLLEIGPGGKTTSMDGSHSEREGALQAYKLWKGLGFISPECQYRIAHIEEVDFEAAMKQPVNEEALGACAKMLGQ